MNKTSGEREGRVRERERQEEKGRERKKCVVAASDPTTVIHDYGHRRSTHMEGNLHLEWILMNLDRMLVGAETSAMMQTHVDKLTRHIQKSAK